MPPLLCSTRPDTPWLAWQRQGITDIVRIGGRSKSERLAPYNLRELSRQRQQQSSAPVAAPELQDQIKQCWPKLKQ